MNTAEELRNIAANAMRELVRNADKRASLAMKSASKIYISDDDPDGAAKSIAIKQNAARASYAETAAALLGIANNAAIIIRNLVETPGMDERDGATAAAVRELAGYSLAWPVSLSSFDVERKRDMEKYNALAVGSKEDMRKSEKAGSPRVFDYQSQTGFARDIKIRLEEARTDPRNDKHVADIFPELKGLTEEQSKRSWKQLAAMLPAFSKESLPKWVEAGVELCRDDCMGDWSRFPWPDCVKGKVGKSKSKYDASVGQAEAIVREKLLEGLLKLSH